MLWAILSISIAAAISPWLTGIFKKSAGWILGALPLGWAVFFALRKKQLAEGELFQESIAWLPGLGVNASFWLDGLSSLFAVLILGIGGLVLIYTSGYLKGHPLLGRFNMLMLFFMASMVGVVFADNIILLFVFWELTSFTSYLLIGFDSHKNEARAAATQALLVTGVGGLAMLAGLMLIGYVGGSYEISELAARSDAIIESDLYFPALILILLGCFTKSAQFPFHFWLPNAMQAPTPASAYLHSSTMVKAGVYLLARLSPIMGMTASWQVIVTCIGAATMFTGAFLGFQQTILKRLLAYSTVSVLGLLVMLIGQGSDIAVKAAMIYLLAHALYKGGLFLVAGAIDHETGERDITRLGGLRKSMPILTAASLLAALSMAGMPPLIGFIGKETVYEAVLESPFAALSITALTVLSSIFMVAIAGLAAVRPFFGEFKETPKHAHEAPVSMWLGPLTLSIFGCFGGIFLYSLGELVIGPSSSAVMGETVKIKLYLWHGFTLVLGLSVLTLASGVALYWHADRIRKILAPLQAVYAWGPELWYEKAMKGLTVVADVQTRILQNGYLRYYIITILGTTLALSGTLLLGGAEWSAISSLSRDMPFFEAALAALALIAAFAAVFSRSRLGAIACLSIVGYSIALIYVVFGSPDLAMTQLVVETLTLILFVLVFYHLPSFKTISKTSSKFRDALIAGAVGLMMTSFVLLASSINGPDTISSYYAETSLVKAYGRNVVNVILVDYRGVDTMGEIVVLSVAAVGAFALLRFVGKGRENS